MVKQKHTFYESEWKKRLNPEIHKRTRKRVGFDVKGLTNSMRSPMVSVSEVTFEPAKKFVETLDEDWNPPVNSLPKFMTVPWNGKNLSNRNLFGESFLSRRGSMVTGVNSKAQSPLGSMTFMNTPKNEIQCDPGNFYANINRSSTFGGGPAKSVLLDIWGNNIFGEASSSDLNKSSNAGPETQGYLVMSSLYINKFGKSKP